MVTLALIVLIGISACGGGYYMVKDPTTDKTYYTDGFKDEKGGSIKLKDANTGSTVTLQNSEITEIKKDGFKPNTKKDLTIFWIQFQTIRISVLDKKYNPRRT